VRAGIFIRIRCDLAVMHLVFFSVVVVLVVVVSGSAIVPLFLPYVLFLIGGVALRAAAATQEIFGGRSAAAVLRAKTVLLPSG